MLGTDRRDMLVPKLPRRRYWSSRPGVMDISSGNGADHQLCP